MGRGRRRARHRRGRHRLRLARPSQVAPDGSHSTLARWRGTERLSDRTMGPRALEVPPPVLAERRRYSSEAAGGGAPSSARNAGRGGGQGRGRVRILPGERPGELPSNRGPEPVVSTCSSRPGKMPNQTSDGTSAGRPRPWSGLSSGEHDGLAPCRPRSPRGAESLRRLLVTGPPRLPLDGIGRLMAVARTHLSCGGRQRSSNDHRPVTGVFDLIHFGFVGSRQEVTAGGGEPEPEDTSSTPASFRDRAWCNSRASTPSWAIQRKLPTSRLAAAHPGIRPAPCPKSVATSPIVTRAARADGNVHWRYQRCWRHKL